MNIQPPRSSYQSLKSTKESKAKGKSGGGGPVKTSANKSPVYWQNGLEHVYERDQQLLYLQKFTDVSFLVGEGLNAREFHCHRLYLAKTSSAFEAMMFGGLAVRPGETVHIPDATPDGFSAMLTYIYEGRVVLDTFSKASGLLVLAKKYLLPESLQQQCRAQLWAMMYPDLVWDTLEFAINNAEERLYNAAFQLLRQDTHRLISHPRFLTIRESTLQMMLQDNLLACSELLLFCACLEWGKAWATCLDLPEPHSPQSVRIALDNILPYIRFLTMAHHDLSKAFLCEPRIISDADALQIFICGGLKDPTDLPEPFCPSTEARLLKPEKMEVEVIGCSKEKLFLNGPQFQENTFHFLSRLGNLECARFPLKKGSVVKLCTQKQSSISKSTSYVEEVTATVFDKRDKPIVSENLTSRVNYESHLVIPCSGNTYQEGAHLMVTFHKSGRYPIPLLRVTEPPEPVRNETPRPPSETLE